MVAGLLKGNCGEKMHGHTFASHGVYKYGYYTCYKCHKRIDREEFDDFIWEEVKEAIKNPEIC